MNYRKYTASFAHKKQRGENGFIRCKDATDVDTMIRGFDDTDIIPFHDYDIENMKQSLTAPDSENYYLLYKGTTVFVILKENGKYRIRDSSYYDNIQGVMEQLKTDTMFINCCFKEEGKCAYTTICEKNIPDIIKSIEGEYFLTNMDNIIVTQINVDILPTDTLKIHKGPAWLKLQVD